MRGTVFIVQGDNAAADKQGALPDTSGAAGQVIRLARLARAWVQRDLAERSGYSQSTISRIENNESRAVHDLHILCDLADCLGIPRASVGIEEFASTKSLVQNDEHIENSENYNAEVRVRPALARFRVELRAQRLRQGWSQRQLAGRVTYTFQYVSQAERHGTNLPSADLVAELDSALRSNGKLNSLHLDVKEETARIRAKKFTRNEVAQEENNLNEWNYDRIIHAVLKNTSDDLMCTRREVVTGGTAVLVGVNLTQPLQRWLSPLTNVRASFESRRRREFAADELSQLSALAGSFRRLARSGNGLLARRSVIAQLNSLMERLEGAVPEDETVQHAFLISSDLADIAASASWDMGMHQSAQRYYITALKLAKIAGDDKAAAMILASLARQCYDLGNPSDGLEIVQLAHYGIRHIEAPIVRSLLATREAWAYAQQGRGNAFRRTVKLAEEYFDEGRAEGVNGIGGFDFAELKGVIGARYRDLALHDPKQAPNAVSYIECALDLRSPSQIQNRAFDAIGLARAYLIDRQFERAGKLIRDTINFASPWLSGRVGRKLSNFYSESANLSASSSELRQVRELISMTVKDRPAN